MGDSFPGVPGSNLHTETDYPDRSVKNFLHSVLENVEIHSTLSQTLRIFVRSFRYCVIRSLHKIFVRPFMYCFICSVYKIFVRPFMYCFICSVHKIFVRPFMYCVVLCIATFCLINDSKSLPSAILNYTTQQIFDVRSTTPLLVVTCVCEAKENTFSTSFLTVVSKNIISLTECNSGTIQKLLIWG